MAACALDVFVGEPKPNPELLAHPHLSVTPHIGAQTDAAQERIGDELVNVVKDFFGLV